MLRSVVVMTGGSNGAMNDELKPLVVVVAVGSPVKSSREFADEEEEGFCSSSLVLLSKFGTWIISVRALKSWWWAEKPRLRSWLVSTTAWILLGFCWGTKSGSFLDEFDDDDDREILVLLLIVVDEDLLFFLEPPPTGMFLRDPPSVQYLLHVLQKYLG